MHVLDTAALLLRATLAVVLCAHGWNHLFGAGGLKGTTSWFASMGLRPARLQALASGVTELAAGAAVLLGLFTSLACGAVIGVMAVALVTAHRRNGFFIFNSGQGWEYVGVLAMTALSLAVLGPGRASVDHALGLAERLDGLTGFLLSAVLGLVGAAVLLATSWRPSRVG